MTTILLTRHGHVDGIKPKRFRGRENLPLTELGRRQAASLAVRIAGMAKPVAIYTSPLQRCADTGAAIGKACGVASSPVDGLMDLDYGTWQMRVQDEVKDEQPDQYALWHSAPHLTRFPGGESLQDLVARTSDALRMVLGKHDGQTVVMVGHDSVNRAILLQLIDQPLSAYWKLAQDPCCLNVIEYSGGRIEVKSINDTAGLPQ
jgi:probable phosphoglycerate mutase